MSLSIHRPTTRPKKRFWAEIGGLSQKIPPSSPQQERRHDPQPPPARNPPPKAVLGGNRRIITKNPATQTLTGAPP